MYIPWSRVVICSTYSRHRQHTYQGFCYISYVMDFLLCVIFGRSGCGRFRWILPFRSSTTEDMVAMRKEILNCQRQSISFHKGARGNRGKIICTNHDVYIHTYAQTGYEVLLTDLLLVSISSSWDVTVWSHSSVSLCILGN